MPAKTLRRTGVPLPLAAAVCGVLAFGGAAAAAGYNPGHLALSDQAQVAGLCTGVLGLSHGNRQFDACMDALSTSLREEGGGRDLAAARSDCLRAGDASPSALARCELADASAAGSRAVAILPVQPPLATRPARSYWLAPHEEVHRREEAACADLGLEPVGRPFARCVAGLDAQLFNANNPSQ